MTKKLSEKQIQTFRQTVYDFFHHHGRQFPWRQTSNPYRILVSEIMLQQTQADRVIRKYQSFIKMFPTVRGLAAAPLSEVLRQWQGLGYNRRALMLQRAAQDILKKYHGQIPKHLDQLRQLPGIGPYTASAVMSIVYILPVVMIETNIRTVFIVFFLTTQRKVSDQQLMPLISQTLDRRQPRRWYNALMDYGAMLKKQHGNPSRQSRQYVRQTKFTGSNRQIRGAVVRLLARRRKLSAAQIMAGTKFSKSKINTILTQLLHEGLLEKRGLGYVLPTKSN